MTLNEEVRQLLLAWQFLTRVPLPAALAAGIDDAAAASGPPVVSARHFATVGLAIGALAAAIWLAAITLWPAPVAAVLTVGATLWLTGAFHEDGLADTCDGLIGFVGRDRALAIMRDSRIGTYGACGLWAVLTGRIVLLTALPLTWVPWALIVGHGLSRAVSMTLMARLPYVADVGSSKLVARMAPLTGPDLAVGWTGVAIAALVAAGATGTPWPWLTAIAAALVGGQALGRWFTVRLGGYTGDCLGATQQLTELIALAALVAVAGKAAGT